MAQKQGVDRQRVIPIQLGDGKWLLQYSCSPLKNLLTGEQTCVTVQTILLPPEEVQEGGLGQGGGLNAETCTDSCSPAEYVPGTSMHNF